jgi:L-alanine-DL-glutamate epimerase-like enolase superfamily enzyme
LDILRALGVIKQRVAVFEQPTPRDDFAALAEVQAKGGVPVAADESLRGFDDLAGLVRQGGISAVNVKTAKVGLFQAHDLLVAARACGFSLMIGGMVETELSMSASACLGAGLGGLAFVDLDTPLFMQGRPLRGGYRQTGPLLDLSSIEFGHGVEPIDVSPR